jgi:hypothetical protein
MKRLNDVFLQMAGVKAINMGERDGRPFLTGLVRTMRVGISVVR